MPRGKPIEPSFPQVIGVTMTAELARMLWTYEPVTGRFTWNVPPRLGVNVGDEAGAIGFHGYRILCFRKKKYKAARIAWLIMSGEFPPKEVDHADTDRTNDQWENLRPADSSQNKCNMRVRKDNALGIKGVCLAKDGKYEAYICMRGKRKNLGRFFTAEEAKAAYDTAAIEFHGKFRRAA